MQAMILAAGYGTRLQPYSLIRPKPLFPILNRPLLLATIERLKNAGFSSIMVNCHHLREQVITAVKGISGVIVQEEPVILGTGGSLGMAIRSLSAEPLLVTNGDIYHTIDFKTLYQAHLGSSHKVTMALHDYPRFNKIGVSGELITGFDTVDTNRTSLAFTGIQVVDPEVLFSIPPDKPSCIIEHYRTMLSDGDQVSCRIFKDINWTDMGTPRDYLELHQGLLQGNIPVWPELHYPGKSSIFVDDEAYCSRNSSFQQWVCIGKARIGPGCSLKRVVVWDGAVVQSKSNLADCIVASEDNP